jgi:hypothetical protein
MQDSIGLQIPPGDIPFVLARTVYGSAREKLLEFGFWDQLADEEDAIDSWYQKIDLLPNPDPHVCYDPQEEN